MIYNQIASSRVIEQPVKVGDKTYVLKWCVFLIKNAIINEPLWKTKNYNNQGTRK